MMMAAICPPTDTAQTGRVKLFSLDDTREGKKKDDEPVVDLSTASKIDWAGKIGAHAMAAPDRARSPRSTTIVLCLNIACLTATLSIGTIIAATYEPFQKLDAMQTSIAAIVGAEGRVRTDIAGASARLHAVIQSRIDRADAAQDRLLGELGSLRTSVEKTAETVRAGRTTIDDRLSAMLVAIADLTTPVAPAPAQFNGGSKRVAAVIPTPADRAGESTSMPDTSTGSPQFERRAMPDGSVAYRRID